MEKHLVGRVVAERVAVDAPRRVNRIVDQDIFVEVRQVALVDAHLQPPFVPGLDKAIGYPLVYRFRRNDYAERSVSHPLGLRRAPRRHPHLRHVGIGQQRAPLLRRNLYRPFAALGDETRLAARDELRADTFGSPNLEIERRDIARHRHTSIIGIDRRQSVDRARRLVRAAPAR